MLGEVGYSRLAVGGVAARAGVGKTTVYRWWSTRARQMLGPRRAANAAVLYHAAGRGELPHDIDPHALLDILAGAILYRSLIRAAPTPTLINQLIDLTLDGPAAPHRDRQLITLVTRSSD